MTAPQITPGTRPPIESLRSRFQEAPALGGHLYARAEPGPRRQGVFSELAARLGAGLQSLGQRLVMAVAPNSVRADRICAQAIHHTSLQAGRVIAALAQGPQADAGVATVRQSLDSLIDAMRPLLARGSTAQEVLSACMAERVRDCTFGQLTQLTESLRSLSSQVPDPQARSVLGVLAGAAALQAQFIERVSPVAQSPDFRELDAKCQAHFLAALGIMQDQVRNRSHENYQPHAIVDPVTGASRDTGVCQAGWKDFGRKGPPSHYILTEAGQAVPLRPSITGDVGAAADAVAGLVLNGINEQLIPALGREQAYRASCYANQDLLAGIETLAAQPFSPYRLPDGTQGRLSPTSHETRFNLRAAADDAVVVDFEYSFTYNTLEQMDLKTGAVTQHPVQPGRGRVVGAIMIGKDGGVQVSAPIHLAAKIVPDPSRPTTTV